MLINKEKIKYIVFFAPLIVLLAMGINSLFIEEEKEYKQFAKTIENEIVENEKPKVIIKENYY